MNINQNARIKIDDIKISDEYVAALDKYLDKALDDLVINRSYFP